MKTFLNTSPFYWHILSFLFAASCAAITYFKHRSNSNISKRLVYVLFLIRFLFVLLICYLTLNLFIKTFSKETQKPVIIVAIDNSESMRSAYDSVEVNTKLAKDLAALGEELKGNYDLKFIKFGQKSKLMQNVLTELNFNENESNFDELFSTIDNNYANLSIGALIIVSDGIYNAGINPTYKTKNIDHPIYTVAVGDTTQTPDISIQKVNHNSIAYLGNIFPVDVSIAAKKFIGKEILVSLNKGGQPVSVKNLKINQQNYASVLSFTANANTTGLQKYSVLVSVLPEEKNKLNNFATFLIDVIDNKEKVLIVANAPHPDVAAVKEALDGLGTYEVDFCLMNEQKSNLKSYSAIVLHGGTEGSNSILMKQITDNMIPIFKIATSDKLNNNRTNEVIPIIDRSFNLFSISDDLKKFIAELPAVNAPFGNYAAVGNEQVLLYQKIGSVETQNPLYYFNETNGLKTAYFTGDGLWRWKLRDYAEHQSHTLFNELISKSIQYLAVKSDKSYFRLNAPKLVNENEAIEFNAEVYNKSYELVNEGDVQLTITSSDNKNFQFTFSKTDNAYLLNAGQFAPGEYKYVAQTKVGNELFKKTGLVTVRALESEKINTVANHQMLNQLSISTNGKFVYQKQLAELKNAIESNETIKPITYSQNSTDPLIELKWLFAIALLLFGLEWYVRKIYLTI
jgi:hypothetical protein